MSSKSGAVFDSPSSALVFLWSNFNFLVTYMKWRLHEVICWSKNYKEFSLEIQVLRFLSPETPLLGNGVCSVQFKTLFPQFDNRCFARSSGITLYACGVCVCVWTKFWKIYNLNTTKFGNLHRYSLSCENKILVKLANWKSIYSCSFSVCCRFSNITLNNFFLKFLCMCIYFCSLYKILCVLYYILVSFSAKIVWRDVL